MNLSTDATVKKPIEQLHGFHSEEQDIRERELRILLVEDSVTDGELVQREIRKAHIPFICRRVQTEEFYRQALHEFSPDIILADYTLPQFSALDALKLVKELRVDIPFILVTGSQSEEVAVRCMKEGASDYILKQSLTRLPSAILNALEKKEAEQKKHEAEHALRLSEERFHLLFDCAPLPIWVYELDTLRFLEVNQAAREHYGYARMEFLRLKITDLQEPPDLVPMKRQLLRYYRHRRKDGIFIDVQVIAHVIEFFGHKAVLMISEDITERKKAEETLRNSREQLRQLSAHLQSIREEERTRMAREIHDEFGQVLTALKIDLSLLERNVAQSGIENAGPVIEKTRQMTALIDTTLFSVRRLATELRPGVLDDIGLDAAIEWQAGEFQARTNIQCDYDSAVTHTNFPQEIATPVFRIFQETLTNVTRHAQATRVWVRLQTDQQQLMLDVRDNGRGITDAELSKRESLGILGMKERALLLGGQLEITGTPGEGTKVALIVPFDRQP